MTTTIVALVDALGNLARFILLPGQRHNSVGGEATGYKVLQVVACNRMNGPVPAPHGERQGGGQPRPNQTNDGFLAVAWKNRNSFPFGPGFDRE